MSYDSFPKAPNLGHGFHSANHPTEPAAETPAPERELDHAVHHHSLEERAYTPGGSVEQAVNRQVAAQGRTDRAAQLHEERLDPHDYYLGQIDEAQQRMIDQMEQERLDREKRNEQAAQMLAKSQEAFNRAAGAAESTQDDGEFIREMDEEIAQDERANGLMREDKEGPSKDYDMPDDGELMQGEDRGELGLDHGPGFYDHDGEWDHDAEREAYEEYLRDKDGFGSHDGPGDDDWGPSGGDDHEL